ncbi:sugar phosphate isomerase/epimerase family protein [Rhodopirellula sp. MGV]|uniref:sugar phosphate isomerase/epimerase family protein n=1 Tax=Rhodopirellula sp. MGV TaxID=2023130 RepID=UPI000B96B808|nr:sugar phosphate isomerase/epimerase [Rhodopirellula sp. MGV]OYP32979.1 xylose isomerase [Rhodopirellula sp. MGV]PNY35363.1 sugar phosphate isomerase/epimerase [Rhodopirellula baltica]
MHNFAPSRRQFLAAVAATASAASLPRVTSAAEDAGYKLGIQLYSLRGYNVDEALQHAHDLGFQQVEFYSGMLPIDSSAEAIEAMKKKVADLGMSISAHGVNRLTKNADENRKLFEFAKALGVPAITADPDPDSFDSLDELVKEFDIRVAIHNHGPRHRYNKAVDVLTAIEGHDERIGACADLGHYIRSGQRPTEVIRLLQGRLFGIHLKDFEEMQDRTKGVILGKGHLDVEGVFMALKSTGFPTNGAISLEYEENPKDPIDDIRQCVSVAKEAMSKL